MGNNLRSKSDRSNVGIQIPVNSAKHFCQLSKIDKTVAYVCGKINILRYAFNYVRDHCHTQHHRDYPYLFEYE